MLTVVLLSSAFVFYVVQQRVVDFLLTVSLADCCRVVVPKMEQIEPTNLQNRPEEGGERRVRGEPSERTRRNTEGPQEKDQQPLNPDVLNQMTVAHLKEVARDRGIKLARGATKAQIIELLLNYEDERPELPSIATASDSSTSSEERPKKRHRRKRRLHRREQSDWESLDSDDSGPDRCPVGAPHHPDTSTRHSHDPRAGSSRDQLDDPARSSLAELLKQLAQSEVADFYPHKSEAQMPDGRSRNEYNTLMDALRIVELAIGSLDPEQQQRQLKDVRELLRLRATAVSVGSAGSWTIAKRIMPKAATFEDEMKPVIREAMKAEKEEKKFMDKYSSHRSLTPSRPEPQQHQSFRAGPTPTRPGVRCFACGAFGHIASQCPTGRSHTSGVNRIRPRSERFRKLQQF